ncbi:outer membrane beta-barrel protein [Pseudoduganella namucuonensis]|uniref:OmpA-OmpF porin, OOP family n=1 Tax=Pseudoduganella namucuonensis TaxID=1035707 RepID=A0A1I7LTH0_9BURK|nr:outer membrane beta-barrel protein [Pseudoduganella namucuonensis]SFV12890.1 OmpA-OmpF porin, OOP family [Pseudoduganella namucuonensis]
MKRKLIVALCTALGLAPVAAYAEDTYAGINLGRAKQKVDASILSSSDDTTAVKVYTGYRYDGVFGVEAGYVQHGRASLPLSGTILTAKPRSLYVAGTATAPLTQQLAAFGKLGASFNRAKFTNFGANGRSESKTTALIGAGLTYAVTPVVSGVLEYEHFGKVVDEGALNLKSRIISAGVRVTF